MLELVFIFCFDMCNFIEALCPDWSELEQAMASVHTVVHGLVKFSKVGAVSCKNLKLMLLVTSAFLFLPFCSRNMYRIEE